MVEIIAGELDTSHISGFEQTAKISNLTIHPDYDASTRENNICLLYLTEDFEINDNVRPIELQSTKPTSAVCITSGWGSFEVSKRVLHPIWNLLYSNTVLLTKVIIHKSCGEHFLWNRNWGGCTEKTNLTINGSFFLCFKRVCTKKLHNNIWLIFFRLKIGCRNIITHRKVPSINTLFKIRTPTLVGNFTTISELKFISFQLISSFH